MYHDNVNDPLTTSPNWLKTIMLGSFQFSKSSSDGSQLKISGNGLPALILAIGAAYGINALWGMIQVFGY